MGIFLGDFGDLQDVCREFEIDAMDLEKEGVYVLLACYATEPYEGSAFVLCMDDKGELYEVNGGHCSCMGLEGQWELEDTSVEALRHRMKHGWLLYGMDKEVNEAMEYVFRILPVLQADG